MNEIVKGLLQEGPSVQPSDFVTLKQLIDARMKGTN